ncbi:MAG: sulfite oxidase-like oxidoreductase [Chloroflexi bacterium HGW-Chloroflexi-8]|jgi:DMSO/TMAO reductase YedYZ molybdopterin-dependent catalytic subunit|nr:MAG: sulfite oxidase-like oxidoreductase [Chloroflexi bacterium HGW-Chloroflexi-8]
MFNAFKRKADEEKMRSEGRIPPGQSLTARFPVLHYGPVPKTDLTKWDLKFWGLVEEPLTLNWDQFNQLPKTTLKMDLHCVTKWSMFDSEWEGVLIKTLIDQGLLKIKPQARFVLQHAEYGYTTNLPLKIMLQDNFLMATHYDGQPISAEHGYPLRGVIGAIPGRMDLETPYLWKGAKWLRGLEFLSEDQLGFWEEAGYHNQADIWKEQRTVY